MSHDEFINNIYSRLSKIISSDPLLSDINCHPSKISFSKLNQYENKNILSISIRRFDNSLINIDISEDAQVFQLKKLIQNKFSNKKLNWKFIWKKYALANSEHQQLINNNRKIKDYQIYNNSQLIFVRRKKSK